MSDQDHHSSPWGEPAAPAAASYRMRAADPAGPLPAVDTGPFSRPPVATSAPVPPEGGPEHPLAPPPKAPRERKRRPILVERTILVRIIPRSGLWVRLRAAVALAVIAVTIGLGGAAVLSVIVWAAARAIHHAAGN
jgi:hypothetical protein